MYVIADSSTARTEWALLNDTGAIVSKAITEGLNPFYQTRREISHSIRLGLPAEFLERRRKKVFFYGAGCDTPEKKQVVEASLISQFKAPVEVESNMTGAARSLLQDRKGIVCILGTGSNSCLWDGEKIVETVKSLGFILGDEGSGSAIGKMFLSDCLRNIAPESIRRRFYNWRGLTPTQLMDSLYSADFPNRVLAGYIEFLVTQIYDEYVYRLVYDSIMAFFQRIIGAYDYKDSEICIVGHTACTFLQVVMTVAADFGVKLSKIEASSMPGLLQYHEKRL